MMQNIYRITLIMLLCVGCSEKSTHTHAEEQPKDFNQALADELAQMAETDQVAVDMPRGKYKKMSREQWTAFQDSVLRTHQKRLAIIFDQYGFPGYDMVGKAGASDFWLMVQHCDFDPDFQQEVLEAMKKEVDKGNAEPYKYAMLVDRVNLNTGKAQVYGSQLDYNTEICQAYPRNLEDSKNVNQRRKAVGLGPIEVYLNEMTEMHFEMNKEVYQRKGINGPKLYEPDQDQQPTK